MDWKKEYRVSDLFRRKAKPEPTDEVAEEPIESAEPPAAAESAEPVVPAADPSVWKKEIHLFGRRKRRDESEQVEPTPTPQEPVVSEWTAPTPAEPPAWPVDEPEPTDEVAEEPIESAEPPAAPESADPTPAESAEPVVPAADPSVWKKQIHLFGRRKRARVEPVEVQAEPTDEVAEEPIESAEPVVPTADPSVWKKEIHLFGRRKRARVEPVEVQAEPAGDEPPAPEEWPSAASAETEPADDREPQPENADLPQPESVDLPQQELPAAEVPEPNEPEEAPEPVAEVEKSEEPAGAVEEEAPPVAVEDVPSDALAPDTSSTSVWKKEIRLGRSSSRKDKKARPRGAPVRRETPPRRDRSPEPRAERSEARGAKPPVLPDIPLFRALNLLPRDEVKVRRPGPSIQQVAVAVIGLIMLGVLSFAFVLERARVQDRQDEVKDLEAQVAAIETPPGVETPESSTQLAGELLTRAGALSAVLDGRIVWDRLLRQLSLVLPQDVWFEGVTSDASALATGETTGSSPTGVSRASRVTITGFARTQDGVAQLLGRLGVLPQLVSVQLQSGELVERGGQDVVHFSVAATLKPEGAVEPEGGAAS